jgi:hypothetical protein
MNTKGFERKTKMTEPRKQIFFKKEHPDLDHRKVAAENPWAHIIFDEQDAFACFEDAEEAMDYFNNGMKISDETKDFLNDLQTHEKENGMNALAHNLIREIMLLMKQVQEFITVHADYSYKIEAPDAEQDAAEASLEKIREISKEVHRLSLLRKHAKDFFSFQAKNVSRETKGE